MRFSSQLMRSKKGFSFDAIWQIILLIILVSVSLLFYFMILWFGNISINTQPAETATLINRIYYSPNGISYNDGLRSYPGIIDLTRFNDEHLKDTISFEKKPRIAAELTLFSMEGKPLGEPIYLNQVWYDRWDVLTAFKGEGAARRFAETRYVLITGDGGRTTAGGFIHFNVIMPVDA